MHEQICAECQTTYREDAEQCPACGAPALGLAALGAVENDPTAQLVRTLLFQARQCQQRGDLIAALKYANDALEVRPACSTVHALLGAIYEQKGELAAARHHFQKALTVTPPPHAADDCLVPMLPPEPPVVRTVSGAWVLPALIACLLFSGLAALFTLWPLDRQVEKGGILKMPIRHTETRPPIRVRHLPPPPPPAEVPREDDRPPAPPRPPAPSATATSRAAPLPVALPVPDAPTETPVLGPSATATMPVVPENPTMEQADEAFFNGDTVRAVAMYEKLLANQPAAGPRVHQHLAKCYNNLGNTQKTRTHLHEAIAGYQAIVQSNPKNEAAQDELKSCQHALENLNVRTGAAP